MIEWVQNLLRRVLLTVHCVKIQRTSKYPSVGERKVNCYSLSNNSAYEIVYIFFYL